ncbi:MAG: hypothetical protein I8H72_04285 [Myxococcaceae bacterium]|nr:hypothetical protein [Myxococcaceae bacterium]
MRRPFSHSLNFYLKQTGTPRYSVRYVERFVFFSCVGAAILASELEPLSLLTVPVLGWLSHRRDIFR